MVEPVISVVVTVYNHEEYLVQAITSVLAQKACPPYEIIIGDDCSSDNSYLIAEKYAKKDDRICLLRHGINLGMQKNLKACLELCRGNYIAICEGDDYWIDEYKLKEQYELLKTHKDAVMCFSDINLLFEDGKTMPHFKNKQKLLPEIIGTKEIILFNGPSATFSCCMYTAQAVQNVPDSFFEDKSNFDLLFNLYVLEYGSGIFLKKVFVNYRLRKNGLWSGKSDDEKKSRSIIGMCVYNELFNYKYSEYFYAVINKFLGQNIKDEENFCEIFSLKIPLPAKKTLHISVQRRKK